MKNEEQKLSSVEWLLNQLPLINPEKWNLILEVAKEMHKEEIKEAFNKNVNGFQRIEMMENNEDWSEIYYNNRYK